LTKDFVGLITIKVFNITVKNIERSELTDFHQTMLKIYNSITHSETKAKGLKYLIIPPNFQLTTFVSQMR
jgi:hypothetical protein